MDKPRIVYVMKDSIMRPYLLIALHEEEAELTQYDIKLSMGTDEPRPWTQRHLKGHV